MRALQFFYFTLERTNVFLRHFITPLLLLFCFLPPPPHQCVFVAVLHLLLLCDIFGPGYRCGWEGLLFVLTMLTMWLGGPFVCADPLYSSMTEKQREAPKRSSKRLHSSSVRPLR